MIPEALTDSSAELKTMAPEISEEELQKIHDKAMKRYQAAKRAWSEVFAAYNADQRFADGDQWDQKVAKERTAAGLSSLVYNKLADKVRYIVNNARKSVPNIKCNPVSNGATKNTAKVLDGIVKQAQRKHNAKAAYIHALKCMVIGGIGSWRVMPVKVDDDYDLKVGRILNPTTVLMDPSAIEQNFSDAEYQFVESWMARDVFDATYAEEDEAKEKPGIFARIGNAIRGIGGGESGNGMFTKDSVKILEYWVKNNTTGFAEQYILNGDRVLKSNLEYRGKHLPVVFLVGEETHIEDERRYSGVVRGVKDMQVLLNLSKSKTADYIGRSSSQQWLVECEQIEGYEGIWLNSNINGAAVLPFKATGAGTPQRLEAPPPPNGFMAISAEADSDIRSAVGIRDPMESIPANIASKTLEMHISQSNIGTLEYIDRLGDMILWTGEIMIDLIPHYYSYPHIREIMGLDGQVSTVQIGAPYIDNGKQVMHDLSQGCYSVTITEGPSYESARAEAADKLTEVAKAYPELMQVAGDIVFRNFDFDGAVEIADRLRAQIPPQILAASSASNGDDADQAQLLQNQVNQFGQQLQQMSRENQQLHQLLQQASQEKATESAKVKEKLQADLELENVKFGHEKELKMLDLNAKATMQGHAAQETMDAKALDNAADKERTLLENHTDIFVAEIQHNARLEAAAAAPAPTNI